MTSVAELLSDATRHIASTSGSPRLDAELLLGHVLKCGRVQLITGADDDVDAEREQRFRGLAERRASGEPVAWLTGRKEFWSMELEVDVGVLVPRADTETLVEAALRCLADQPQARVLELGTGTGAIAIALAVEGPELRITATDRCDKALDNAARNIERFAAGRIELRRSDWFDALEAPPAGAPFDLLLSNPPYIAEGDPALQGDGLRHEPRTALVSDNDGLSDLQTLIAGSPAYLRSGGTLMLEHGADQSESVRVQMEIAGFTGIRHHEDLSGHLRVSSGMIR